MKTKLLLLTLSAFGFILTNKVKAQGNLQFNQVITMPLSNSLSYTVPTGKVFKLQVAQIPSTIRCPNCGLTATPGLLEIFPVWFKQGDILTSTTGGNCFISGIEFNVIP